MFVMMKNCAKIKKNNTYLYCKLYFIVTESNRYYYYDACKSLIGNEVEF